jgi:type I restriction-modification system DNA methylase subunit
MNLAVHGLEGDIREANTFYEDVHNLFGKCDFVSNPPFNVDEVDAERDVSSAGMTRPRFAPTSNELL